MKLGKIKAACKARQMCYILQDVHGANQWISNGQAFYKLEGIWLDENSVRAIFDIPEKKWHNDWAHKVVDVKDMRAENAEMIYTVWLAEQEVELEPCPMRFLIYEEIRCFKTPDGRVVYAPAEDFKPLEGNVRYALRRAPGCEPVIAVYHDLLCEGGVMVFPEGAVGKFKESLKEYADMEVMDYE